MGKTTPANFRFDKCHQGRLSKKLSTKQIVHKIYTDPKYAGKHIVAIAGKIFAADTGDRAADIFEEQVKKHPKETPLATYIPDADTMIFMKSYSP